MLKNLFQATNEAIASGTAHISAEQNRNGSFPSFSSSKKSDFSKARRYTTTFFAANILACLNGCHDAFQERRALAVQVGAIREKTARFLISEKSDAWSFNYWARGAKEYKTMPYPDDLDDTFVALAALQGYDHNIVHGEALAGITKILMAVEAETGGPYRTWLIASDAMQAWRDVDIAVNANIAYFLSSFFGVAIPNLATFIDKQVQAGNLGSPYYPGAVQVIYFISRFYKGKQKSTLADSLMTERGKDGLWENSLDSAMAISALINLGFAESVSDADVATFLRGIRREGWKPWAFCIDPSRGGKTHYAGSSALTAAFCIQALTQHAGLFIKKASAPKIDTIFEKIKSLARERSSGLPRNLKELTQRKINDVNDKEIVTMLYVIRDAIGERCTVSPRILDELALANLYGWMAYTIYDDFLDAEGDPLSLPAANFFLRELTVLYTELNRDIPALGKYFEKIVNRIDDANLWEQRYCRAEIKHNILVLPRKLPYQSIGNLADRSLGHALPAAAIFFALGYAPDSAEVNTLISFFQHYLIARQLNDDAHDWRQDLARGQINSVAAKLLREWRKQEGVAHRRINLADSLPELQRLFWHTVIDDVVQDVHSSLTRAREDLARCHCLEYPEVMASLLDRLSASAEKTLRERAKAIDFLEHY